MARHTCNFASWGLPSPAGPSCVSGPTSLVGVDSDLVKKNGAAEKRKREIEDASRPQRT